MSFHYGPILLIHISKEVVTRFGWDIVYRIALRRAVRGRSDDIFNY